VKKVTRIIKTLFACVCNQCMHCWLQGMGTHGSHASAVRGGSAQVPRALGAALAVPIGMPVMYVVLHVCL
jgi:hypothetical protein